MVGHKTENIKDRVLEELPWRYHFTKQVFLFLLNLNNDIIMRRMPKDTLLQGPDLINIGARIFFSNIMVQHRQPGSTDLLFHLIFHLILLNLEKKKVNAHLSCLSQEFLSQKRPQYILK